MIRLRQIIIFPMLLLLTAGPLPAQEEEERDHQEEAAYRLEIARAQYDAGDYRSCLETLDGYISDHNSKTFVFPHAQMAEVYRLRALLAYAFRGDGDAYRDEVRNYLEAALVENPEVELGPPSEIPVFVQELFYRVREEYLGRFSRTSRRFTVGLLGALVIDPTLLIDPTFLQPGIYYLGVIPVPANIEVSEANLAAIAATGRFYFQPVEVMVNETTIVEVVLP